LVEKTAEGEVTLQVQYVYDVYNHRIAKLVDLDGEGALPTTTERYVYEDDDIALVFDGEGILTDRYLNAPGIDQVLAEESDSGTVWALTDLQGSIRDLVDSNGTLTNHISYDSFGNITTQTNPSAYFRFGFTGQEFDVESGNYYYWNRYFDPGTGRFLSQDPLGFGAGDANLYRYVGNSPTNFTDPNGMLTLGRGNPIVEIARTIHPTFGVVAQQIPGIEKFDVEVKINAGEKQAEEAQAYWADRFNDEKRSPIDRAASFGMGLFPSLWTCENSDATAGVLTTAWGGAKPAAGLTRGKLAQSAKGVLDDIVNGAKNALGKGKPGVPAQNAGLARGASSALGKADDVAGGLARTSSDQVRIDRATPGFSRPPIHVDDVVDFAPGYNQGTASRKLRRSFSDEVQKLGFDVSYLKDGKSFVRGKTVHINPETATPGTLLDEYSHIFNRVNGRGTFLPENLAQTHRNLASEANILGSTNALGPTKNTLFHQLELKNFIDSGQATPSFIRAIPQQEVDFFINGIDDVMSRL
jgi:RHS repeat-associated protein